MSMATIQNAISNFIDNQNASARKRLEAASDLTTVKILSEIRQGMTWEQDCGYDPIDSEAYRYGEELAENNSPEICEEISEMLK